MSRNQANDMAIAREAQLIFTYAPGFKPVGNGLTRWQGKLKAHTSTGEKELTVEVFIPLKFPVYPPRIIVQDKNIAHPNIERDGNVLLQITHNWKPDIHVYQVIQAASRLFAKVPPKISAGNQAKSRKVKASVPARETVKGPHQRKAEDIEERVSQLQAKIKAREEELRRLRREAVKGSDERIVKVDNLNMMLPKDKTQSDLIMLKAQKVALEDLLSTLDGKFKDGEISPVDFAKIYRKYTKELYLVSKKLEKIS